MTGHLPRWGTSDQTDDEQQSVGNTTVDESIIVIEPDDVLPRDESDQPAGEEAPSWDSPSHWRHAGSVPSSGDLDEPALVPASDPVQNDELAGPEPGDDLAGPEPGDELAGPEPGDDLAAAELADPSSAELPGAAVPGATLAEAELAEAELAEAELSEAELAEAELSEAELAEAELAEPELAEAELSEDAVELPDAAVGSIPATPASVDTALKPTTVAPELADERWHEVLASFVDDPQASVTAAAALVDEQVSSLIELLRQRQAAIRTSTGPGQQDNTEDLRLALRGYRDFGSQLLSSARALTAP